MLQRKYSTRDAIDESANSLVPLREVHVDARIRSFAADVTITQIFENRESVPIEAVYCFPIEEQAAVYSFVARIGDREIVAELKEKRVAQREYDNALREHHGAYLLEQDESSPDNFIINVGALPPNEQCHIRISYVTELDLVANGSIIRFVVPTTIAPRYNPTVGTISSPVSQIPTEYVQSAPYTLTFDCQVDKTGVSRVSSLTHPIQVDFHHDELYQIRFAQDNTHLDRDIIVDIHLAEKRSNPLVALESGALMATFTPTEDECRQIFSRDKITNEFLFIIDCSGSMNEENKIGLARQAMLLFLKSLPLNCLFNIIRFGSHHKNLFDEVTAIYSDDNVRRAEQLCSSMTADLGGTELLHPLQWLEKHPPSEGHSRQIFLLSDGEISNVDEVLRLCRSMSVHTRIFSFGLGSSPSRALIKGLARSTNGRFVFIPPFTSVDFYVGEQLQKALQPCLTNVHVRLNIDANLVDIVPRRSPPVFVHDRLVIYVLPKNERLALFDQPITVELFSEEHRLAIAEVSPLNKSTDTGAIGRLAGKARLLELQHTQGEVGEIVAISLRHHILSPHTAFVGVEKRQNGNNTNLAARHVPIEISAGNSYANHLQHQLSSLHAQHLQHRQAKHLARNDIDRARELRAANSELSDHSRRRNGVWKDLERAYKDYSSTLHELIDIVDKYDRARDEVHSRDHLERICGHYDETRRSLDQIQWRYRQAKQQMESSAKCSADLVKRSQRILDDHRDHSYRHEIDEALHFLRRLDYHLYESHESSDRTDEEYTEMIQSLNESYLPGKEPSIQDHRQLAMRNKRLITSFKTCLQETHKDLQAHHSGAEHCAYFAENVSDKLMSSARETIHRSQHHMHELSAKVERAEQLARQQRAKPSKNKFQTITEQTTEEDLELVRHVIAQQHFDGLWTVDDATIKKLTGKCINEFEQLDNTAVLITAIVIVVFEGRFASLSVLWFGVVQKARQCLTAILNNDATQLDNLLAKIRKQLE